MAEKNKKVLVIGIAGALTEATKEAISELLKSEKDVVIIDGAEIEKSLEESKVEIEKLGSQSKSLFEENQTLKSELADLSAELDSVQKTADAGYVTVKSGKKTYRVLGKKFSYQNVEYTAEQLVKNSKLVDELVGIGSGFLIEVKGESK